MHAYAPAACAGCSYPVCSSLTSIPCASAVVLIMYIVLCSKVVYSYTPRAQCGCLYLHHSAVVTVLGAVVGVGICHKCDCSIVKHGSTNTPQKQQSAIEATVIKHHGDLGTGIAV
eukprot:2878-Heterococcus_DN1.PRE.1